MNLVPVKLQQLPPLVLLRAAKHAVAEEVRRGSNPRAVQDILAAALDPSDNVYWVSREAYRSVFGERAA